MTSLPENPRHDDAGQAAQPATVLCVDDESNILSALRRLLRTEGYRVVTATGGAEGLQQLERGQIDVVISDMRMPEMDGAEFLAQVAQRWPDTMRILLTGYADLGSTVAAINEGSIYRYIGKPWEDGDLVVAVRRALEHQEVDRERRRLLDLTQCQNAELAELNQDLEAKVEARTEEIRQTADFLEVAYGELQQSYRDAVQVFGRLVELREGSAPGHGRRVADVAHLIGEILDLPEDELRTLWDAALLHDIGKIGLPDAVLQTPCNALSPKARELMQRHPVAGQAALMSLAPLEAAGAMIRAHHERFDGEGYPDGLSGEAIPLGARILAVADQFDMLQTGALLGQPFSRDEARAYIVEGRGRRYDPTVVDAFLQALERQPDKPHLVAQLKLVAEDLRPGMIVAEDIQTPNGMLLLAEGRELTSHLINRLRSFERDAGPGIVVRIRAEEGDTRVSTDAGG